MELQLAGLPCVVAYRAHLLTEWIIRLKTKSQFISLPNILLDSPIIPEVLFGECTSQNLVAILRYYSWQSFCIYTSLLIIFLPLF